MALTLLAAVDAGTVGVRVINPSEYPSEADLRTNAIATARLALSQSNAIMRGRVGRR
jgi:hypothetical protein